MAVDKNKIKAHEALIKKSQSTAKPAQAGGAHSTAGKAVSSALYRMMDAVKEKPIEWLWPGRIACGKVTLIAGDPGLGKSQITAALAGVVTRGDLWPVDLVKCNPGAVVFLSSEDDAADTIKPRLVAVGADLSKCAILDSVQEVNEAGAVIKRSFNLKSDLDRLARVIREIGNVRLIVVDPITAYLGGVDSHKNSDVRALLSPLGDFAEKNRLAILGVSHLNKSTAQDALLRINGSLAFVAAARAAFIAVKDKNDPGRRLLLPLKNNLAKDTGGLAFSIADYTLESGIETSRIEWEPEPVTITADEALSASVRRQENSQIEEAKRFLSELLDNIARPSSEVKAEAEEAGYSWATIRRAQEELGIKPKKETYNGGWIWRLPNDLKHEDAQTPLQTNEHLRRDRMNKGVEVDEAHEDAHVVEAGHLGKNTRETESFF